MMKLAIVFIILIGMLITGIFVLIKPSIFSSTLSPYDKSQLDKPPIGPLVSKKIIMLGSVFIIIGLVGLSVLGFRIYKELQAEVKSEN